MEKSQNRTLMITGIVVLAAILALILVLVIRTYTYPFITNKDVPQANLLPPPLSEQSIQRLVGGIRIPTISESVGMTENNPFDRFVEYLPSVYPNVYSTMETMTVNKYGLLFRWAGKSNQRNPILLLSHYDVVPVVGYDPVTDTPGPTLYRPEDAPQEPITGFQSAWDYPPFSGAVAGGRIYGRGTLDMKGMLFSILEAADALILEGFRPEQDIWFAFGFDEEIGGTQGALKMADYFKQQGITFDAVYDEGGIIVAPGLGGINSPMGLVGMAEKGFCTIRITVRATGGHSSMPPPKGSLVYAAEIIQKLNEEQMPLTLIPPVSAFLDRAGATMGFTSRMAIANKWLLKGRLMKTLSKTPATNALVRTTTAVTMAKGSDAPNVMASVAEVTVNYRILTGETVEMVINHVRRICEGYDVDIAVLSAREPSNLSPEDAPGFRIIRNTISRLYPEVSVTPYVTIGGTDGYKYEAVSNNVYRFMPVYLNEYEQRTIHNENEYISFDNYNKMITYFKEVMRNFGHTE